MRGIIDFGLKYLKKDSNEFQGFSDTDKAAFIDDSKNTSGFCFSLGSVVSHGIRRNKKSKLSFQLKLNTLLQLQQQIMFIGCKRLY